MIKKCLICIFRMDMNKCGHSQTVSQITRRKKYREKEKKPRK